MLRYLNIFLITIDKLTCSKCKGYKKEQLCGYGPGHSNRVGMHWVLRQRRRRRRPWCVSDGVDCLYGHSVMYNTSNNLKKGRPILIRRTQTSIIPGLYPAMRQSTHSSHKSLFCKRKISASGFFLVAIQERFRE